MKTPQKLNDNTHQKSQPESSKVRDEVQLLDAGNAQQLLNITTKTLRRLQKLDRFCKRKVHDLKTDTHNEFYLNNENIFKKKNNCKQPGSQHYCHPNPSDLHSTSQVPQL